MIGWWNSHHIRWGTCCFTTQKYLKSKKYLQRAKKLHQNWLLIRMPQNMYDWLMKQPPHQVRNMLLHHPKVSKVKEISAKGQKAAPKLVVNQNATKHAWLADETATISVRNMLLHPQRCLKSKKYLQRAKKLHQNSLLIRMPQNMHDWLMKQPPHQVRNIFLHPPKVSKVKEISAQYKLK